jgi:hypothetical protein
MRVTVKDTTRELSKKDKLVLDNSNFIKVSEIIKAHGTCTIENPDIAVHAAFPKKEGGSFDLYVMHGTCIELSAALGTGERYEGWYQIGAETAGEQIMTLVREMTGEEEPYMLRIDLRRSKQDPSRSFYNVDII